MVFPWISFLKDRGKRLSDIEYLAIKEFGGKIVTNDGSATGATGDVAKLTANTGKDMYLAKAMIMVAANSLTLSKQGIVTVVLKVNGVIKETTKITIKFGDTTVAAGRGGGAQAISHQFNVQGLKVAAAQIIKTEVTVAAADIDVFGSLVCFEEPTGGDPRI